MKDYEIKGEIVQVARMMSERGLVGTYEGNLSVRRGDRIYVTPSAHSKELLTEGQILTCDLAGNVLEGELAPTSEIPMHTRCYELRPDIGSVIHCHAPYATAFAQANLPVENRISPEFLMLFGKVPLLRYGRPGTPDIIAELPDHIDEYDVFLLANHGVLAVGGDVMEAFSKTLSLEMLLQTEFIRRAVTDGADCSLSEEECRALLIKGRPNHGNQSRVAS
ncbi:MAG: class II aldolase/adducin family protein [Propionicimonas sp.]